MNFFFIGNAEKIRFGDYYAKVNTMIKWSRQEQLGFCFHLLDHNNDGLICIQDMFFLLKELNDEDFVLKEDVNKLIQILREKARLFKMQQGISPIIYGIYSDIDAPQTEPKLRRQNRYTY